MFRDQARADAGYEAKPRRGSRRPVRGCPETDRASAGRGGPRRLPRRSPRPGTGRCSVAAVRRGSPPPRPGRWRTAGPPTHPARRRSGRTSSRTAGSAQLADRPPDSATVRRSGRAHSVKVRTRSRSSRWRQSAARAGPFAASSSVIRNSSAGPCRFPGRLDPVLGVTVDLAGRARGAGRSDSWRRRCVTPWGRAARDPTRPGSGSAPPADPAATEHAGADRHGVLLRRDLLDPAVTEVDRRPEGRRPGLSRTDSAAAPCCRSRSGRRSTTPRPTAGPRALDAERTSSSWWVIMAVSRPRRR